MYKTAFMSPKGAKLSEKSILEMTKYVLEVLVNGVEPDCSICPLTYNFAENRDTKYCWLIEDYKVRDSLHTNIWSLAKCELEDYENFVLKLIKQSYGK